jgi:orotidine-5'-phosphate decarboxylase
MKNLGDRVVEAVRRKQSSVCVGLDPRSEWIPKALIEEGKREFPHSALEATASAVRAFCIRVLELVEPFAVAVKPQFAFFEALSVPGYAALMDVCAHARKLGLLVIADAKRGDIDTTATAYAEAYLQPIENRSPVADAITINAYMGFDGVAPFLRAGEPHGGGAFVLVKTSNPSSVDFQDLTDAAQVPLYARVAEKVESWNNSRGEWGYGSLGAVVGATWPEHLKAMRKAMPHSIILVPGYGAQGGGAHSVEGAFDEKGQGALITASRSVVFPWAKLKDAPSQWEKDVKAQASQMRDELLNVVGSYQ